MSSGKATGFCRFFSLFPKQQSKQRCFEAMCGCRLGLFLPWSLILTWITAEWNPLRTWSVSNPSPWMWVTSETLGPMGLALLQVSPLTATASCSVNNTQMGDGEESRRLFAPFQVPQCPTSGETLELASHWETDPHFRPFWTPEAVFTSSWTSGWLVFWKTFSDPQITLAHC